jgi:hypothetical protein
VIVGCYFIQLAHFFMEMVSCLQVAGNYGVSHVPQAAEKIRRLRVYSRPATLLTLDQRTREARIMRETRSELTAHVGGSPSATQRALIERAVALTLRIAMMDAKQHEAISDHDNRTYLAWCNTLTRLMRQLGLKGAAQRPPTVAEIMRQGKPA